MLDKLPADLDPNTKLSALLGEVARRHAQLNASLSHLWRSLATPSLAEVLLPDLMDQLATQSRMMLAGVEAFTDGEKAMGYSAIEYTRQVHAVRNDLLHQTWILHEPEGEGQYWTRRRLPRQHRPEEETPPQRLANVAEVVIALATAEFRIFLLTQMLNHVRHPDEAEWLVPWASDEQVWAWIGGQPIG